MKQEAFESQNQAVWEQFEQWLASLTDGKSQQPPEDARPYPVLYRMICHHLALARTRQYSAVLQNRLNHLVIEGHQFLYQDRGSLLVSIARFLARDFPAALRAHRVYFFWSCIAFFGTGLLTALMVQLQPEFVYMILDSNQLSTMESMYVPNNSAIGRERASDTDVAMFGFYIYNNITIGFQCFAGGLVFGLGSLFFLIFNGLHIGAIASHLTSAGLSSTFWPFVSGHSSFELTAIVIFGAIGLSIGRQLIAPGRKARWHAVADQARACMPLIYGGTLMLLIAAFVEAFWSSTSWPPASMKYAVGIGLWILHIIYFWKFGRDGSQ